MKIVLISALLLLTLNAMVVFDFKTESGIDQWLVVNDDVMGGRSQASFELTADGTGLFKGKISLENNGGFSSLRHNMDALQTKDYTTLAVRLKGDGKNYQLRIREKESDYFSYIATFETSGEWETIEVSLAEMYPSFRGRKLDGPNFNGNSMVELTFLIGNKKAESFALEIATIVLK